MSAPATTEAAKKGDEDKVALEIAAKTTMHALGSNVADCSWCIWIELTMMVLYILSVLPGTLDFIWLHVVNDEREYWVETTLGLFVSNCYKINTWLSEPMPLYFNSHIAFSILFSAGLVINKHLKRFMSQDLHQKCGFIVILFGLVIVVSGAFSTLIVHPMFKIPLLLEGIGVFCLLVGTVVTGKRKNKAAHKICVQCLIVSCWISIFVGGIQRIFQYAGIYYIFCKCSGVALAFIGVIFTGLRGIYLRYIRRKRLHEIIMRNIHEKPNKLGRL